MILKLWDFSIRRLIARAMAIGGILSMGLSSVPAFAAAVRIGDSNAFDVPYGAGKLTAANRAQLMQKNVDNALVASADRSPNAVAITLVKNQPMLTLGGFYVGTADDGTAKHLGISSMALAQRWKLGLKKSLSNNSAVESYIARLTGSGNVAQTGTTTTQSGSFPYYRSGRVIYVPAGMVIPVALTNSISSEYAHAGDQVTAKLVQPVNLGQSEIPANTMLTGVVTSAAPGSHMSHSGALGLKFNNMQLPDGSSVPITAHISGTLGKFEIKDGQTDTFHGETTTKKIEDAALRGAIGAGGGALVGTMIGAIASHGRGTGRGALAGLTIGTALGVADSLLLRKGANVEVPTGQTLNLQLDAPAQITDSVESGQ